VTAFATHSLLGAVIDITLSRPAAGQGTREGADTPLMALRYPALSSRFFIALFVLLASLVGVGVASVYGLRDVQAASNQVFSDNYVTAQHTSDLAIELGRAESLSLRIVAAPDAATATELRTQLDQVVIPKVNTLIATFMQIHAADPPAELRTISRITPAWRTFLDLREHGGLARLAPAAAAQRSSDAREVTEALDPLATFITGLQPVESNEAAGAHADATGVFHRSELWLLLAALIALVAAIAMVRIGLTLRRLVEQQSIEVSYGEAEGEYVDMLQVTENEDEAQELLRRYVERSLTGARAVVLARNNSADRLEPKTSLAELDSLRESLVGATPRSCLAVRFGRAHSEGGARTPLMNCEICGALPGSSSCEPLLVGGEVIGAVLINQQQEPDERHRRHLREAVGQAAPVLANLRNLAIAQLRASTDALTGLPNQRAVQDTLKRMVAQATRTISPLAALLLDLDHFKQVNDLYGHDRGDEVLAAVGVALRNVVRDSDFVGRYGGEEFLVLLPATDQEGAVQLGQAIRGAIAAITLPNFDRPITASVGVALLPQDGGDAVTLFRSADRALYAAKRDGRDRLETASASLSEPAAEAA
jgi:diguanylate cyclase (GGDEF)-like protein